MSSVLQIVRLPLPPGYAVPADLPISYAFDDDALAAIDPDAVEVIITHSLAGMPMPLWERLPKLRLIANLGVGIDKIDLDEARRRGIRVSYTPDQLTGDVADLAMAYTLALSRLLVPADAFLRAGQWSQGPFPLATSLAGRRMGILGLGRIGRAIASRAAAFGIEVGYHGRAAKADTELRFFETPAALAGWADILVAALPGGTDTDGLISAELLALLGSNGLVINVARQSVIDEPALIAALSEGRIAGAGLEIFAAGSTLPAQLEGIPNVIVTPHVGSATLQTRIAMADAVFANVRAALDGATLADLAC